MMRSTMTRMKIMFTVPKNNIETKSLRHAPRSGGANNNNNDLTMNNAKRINLIIDFHIVNYHFNLIYINILIMIYKCIIRYTVNKA